MTARKHYFIFLFLNICIIAGAPVFEYPTISAKDFDAVLDITLQNNNVSIIAENATIKDLIIRIKDKSGVQIDGLEYRNEDTFSFKITNSAIEYAFKSLLKHLGENSYAFEYKGDHLYRIAVVKESKLTFEHVDIPEFQPTFEEIDIEKNPPNRFLNLSVIPEMFKKSLQPDSPETEPNDPADESLDDDQSTVLAVKVVRVVKTSQADKAGIREGDIILDYDGIVIENPEMLIREVQENTDKETIMMSVSRGEETFEVSLQGGFIGVSIVPVIIPE